ncbi:hypothetical protein LX32DRAFT_645595 [Colletotrichum zoysiae]|uniref:Secreted protein n=1 Tax=Colletotrichum zoysiae TaxID=1216348 RepID=A0AAD9H528_9PEZI|nr:hypothetical protein LX32DRAFT_645595 [Colletotrichum zoysiae]
MPCLLVLLLLLFLCGCIFGLHLPHRATSWASSTCCLPSSSSPPSSARRLSVLSSLSGPEPAPHGGLSGLCLSALRLATSSLAITLAVSKQCM